MPPLGPDFQNFEKVSNDRLRTIEAKEKSAALLARTLLPENNPTRRNRFVNFLGKFAHGSEHTTPTRPASSVVAYYEHEDGQTTVPMAAFFSDAGTGCLFTQRVLAYDGSGEPVLGPLEARAAIMKNGYYGYPVVALDDEGREVFPDTMTIDDREAFIDDVTETLALIQAQSGLASESNLQSSVR